MRVLGGASAYGAFEAKPTADKVEKGFYARVWKYESKGWRIASEVVHLHPEK